MRSQFKVRWAQRVQAALWRRRARNIVNTATPVPVPPTSEWDTAFARVESYLRAHRIESRVLLNHLATDVIHDARTLAIEHPDEPPVTLAMHIAHARISEWFVHALGGGDWADERFRARARLAILMADVPARCPELFLSPEPLPANVAQDLATAQLQPGPDLKLTSMPSAPLEFGLPKLLDEKWETFSRVVFLRSATSWLVLFGLLGLAWFFTH